jgi:hypothetical protein
MKIVVIGGAGLIGSKLVNFDEETLVPSAAARIGSSRILAWLDRQAPA